MGETIDWTRVLKRYHEPKRARKPFIAVDIETNGLGGELLMGAWCREGETELHWFTTAEEWIESLFAREQEGHIWFAHNGGEYDFKYLIDPLRHWQEEHPTATIRFIQQGITGRIIGIVIRYQKKRYELRDSYALIPSNLASLTRSYAPEYVKQDIGLKEGVIFDPQNPTHREYLAHDVLGLLSGLVTFYAQVKDIFHVTPGWTAPATALRAWQATIPKGVLYRRLPKRAEEFCRKAYYGGLVFLTSTAEHQDAMSIDVNSMYPSVMRDYGVPTGTAWHTTTEREGSPAFYHVRVRVPEETPFTCIPLRTKNGVLWPTGTFESYISSHELAIGRSYGMEFEILDGFTFSEESKIFAEFIDTCEQLRIQHKGTAIEQTVKIMQNGLYGKFGSQSMGTSLELRMQVPEKDFTKYQPVVVRETGEVIPDLYEKHDELKAPYIQPHWAAWITSRARMRLVHICDAIGFDQVFYGDTDSVTGDRQAIEDAITAGRVVVSNRYGDVKIENRYEWFRAAGPKNYQGMLCVDGKVIDKAKGISKRVLESSEHLRAMSSPEQVTVAFESMNSTRSVLTRGTAFAQKRTRSYSRIENSAGWRVRLEGQVRPVHVDQDAASG